MKTRKNKAKEQEEELLNLWDTNAQENNESSESDSDNKNAEQSDKLTALKLRQAALIWLAVQNPTGIGINVPTRFHKYQADIAAFWSLPAKRNLYAPQKTVIIEIRLEREECWPDISKQSALLQKLIELKEEKRHLEEIIRTEEPELKDTDGLFSEYESWQFKNSKNKKYHKCLKEIEATEHSIYKGSKFEQIRRAHVADNLYIAVPEGLIHPDELADGWDLIYVSKDLKVNLIKKPDEKDCSDASRMHLVQTISSSALKYVLFSQGVNISAQGEFFITYPPHRRRKTPDRPSIQ